MSLPPPRHLPDRRIPGRRPSPPPVDPFVVLTVIAGVLLVAAILLLCTSPFRAPIGWGI
jgi:hypothetical protein